MAKTKRIRSVTSVAMIDWKDTGAIPVFTEALKPFGIYVHEQESTGDTAMVVLSRVELTPAQVHSLIN